jgi:hypothetical protein
MEEKTYTREELLQYAIETLNNVNVPGRYLLQIGRPISNVLDTLDIIRQIFDAENKELGQMNPPTKPGEASKPALIKEEAADGEREPIPEAGE